METKMKNPLRFQVWMVLAIVFAVCSLSFAEEKIGIWKPTNLIGAHAPLAQAVGPQGDVWALLECPETVLSLVRSPDGGDSWTTVTHQIEYPLTYEGLLAVDLQNCAWVYTPQGGLSRFSPDGDLLTTTGLAISVPGHTCMVFSPDGYLYRIDGMDELDRISVSGQVRTTPLGFPGERIWGLAVDPSGVLFTAGDSIRRSRDGGLNWERVFECPLDDPLYYISTTQDGAVYAVHPYGIRSTDGGKTWESFGLPGLERPVWGLPDGSIVFAATWEDPPNQHKFPLFRSWDKGNTWTEFLPGITKADCRGGWVAGTYGERIVYAYFLFEDYNTNQHGLYRMLLPRRAAAKKNWIEY